MEIGISLFAGLFLVFFGFRWNKNRTSANPAKKKSNASKGKSSINRITNPFRCVEIEPCIGACEAVKQYQHIKILLDKAPALPLRGCDRKKCECKFIRHNDRRSDDRRERQTSARQAIAGTQVIANNQDKRAKDDRRGAQSKN